MYKIVKYDLDRVDPKHMHQSCFDKNRYNSKNTARDYAAKLAKRHDHPKQNAYHCQICDGWHLTSSDKVSMAIARKAIRKS